MEHDTCSLSCRVVHDRCELHTNYFWDGWNYRDGKSRYKSTSILPTCWTNTMLTMILRSRCQLPFTFHKLNEQPTNHHATSEEGENFVNTLRKQWDHSDPIDIHIRWILLDTHHRWLGDESSDFFTAFSHLSANEKNRHKFVSHRLTVHI